LINDTVLITAIDNIAAKLGIAATEIFTIFAEAQAIKGISTLLLIGIVGVLSLITFKRAFKWMTGYSTFHEASEADDNELFDETIGCLVLTGILTAVYLIIAGVVRSACIEILCPEYSAMLEIIGCLT
jgi:hypothetical protein